MFLHRMGRSPSTQWIGMPSERSIPSTGTKGREPTTTHGSSKTSLVRRNSREANCGRPYHESPMVIRRLRFVVLLAQTGRPGPFPGEH